MDRSDRPPRGRCSSSRKAQARGSSNRCAVRIGASSRRQEPLFPVFVGVSRGGGASQGRGSFKPFTRRLSDASRWRRDAEQDWEDPPESDDTPRCTFDGCQGFKALDDDGRFHIIRPRSIRLRARADGLCANVCGRPRKQRSRFCGYCSTGYTAPMCTENGCAGPAQDTGRCRRHRAPSHGRGGPPRWSDSPTPARTGCIPPRRWRHRIEAEATHSRASMAN